MFRITKVKERNCAKIESSSKNKFDKKKSGYDICDNSISYLTPANGILGEQKPHINVG